uniref:H-caldesmon n=1 Tax=Rhipicephalus zambeziensis TaxID=60191 RepID=A0A224YR68_9ACAR
MAFWHQHRPPPPLPQSNQGFGGAGRPTLPNQGFQTWPTVPQGQPSPSPYNMPPPCVPPPAPQQFYPPPSLPQPQPPLQPPPMRLPPLQPPTLQPPPPMQPPPHFPENSAVRPPQWMNSVPLTQPVKVHTSEMPLEEASTDDMQTKGLPQWLQDKVKQYESSQQSSIKKENVRISEEEISPLIVLREALEALETLKNLETLADSLVLRGNDEQWSALMQHVELHQAKLQSRCQQLSKEGVLSRLLTSVERRRKKRERLKRQRVRREQEAQEHVKHVAMIEAKINARRQRILERANQERQEEEMKEEVDSILGEIRFKISRTREYLEKLEAMKQLRAARKESYQQKGLYVAPEADSNFEEGVSSVQHLLEDQLSDYLKEETALKVMLETEQKEQYESNKLANKQAAVLKSLFGSTEVNPEVLPFNKLYTSSNESVDSLAWVRNSWDRFLVPPDHPAGSSVPVQWVVPQEPSSHSWAMYCAS